MIFLDMSVEDLLRKYPHLRPIAERKCLELGLILDQAKPFTTSSSIGLILNPGSERPTKVIVKRK
jgi:hypothetical protein